MCNLELSVKQGEGAMHSFEALIPIPILTLGGKKIIEHDFEHLGAIFTTQPEPEPKP